MKVEGYVISDWHLDLWKDIKIDKIIQVKKKKEKKKKNTKNKTGPIHIFWLPLWYVWIDGKNENLFKCPHS